MSEPWDEPSDPEVADALRSALREVPSELLPRLERVAAAGRQPVTQRRETPLWLELAPQVGAVVFLFAFVAGMGPRLALPGVQAFLALQLAILLGIELVRGAPLVRAWLR